MKTKKVYEVPENIFLSMKNLISNANVGLDGVAGLWILINNLKPITKEIKENEDTKKDNKKNG